MYEVSFTQYPDKEYAEQSRGAVESSDTGHTGAALRGLGLNSAVLFGPEGNEGCCDASEPISDPDGTSRCAKCYRPIPASAGRENIRSYIKLAIPVPNPVLIGSRGAVLATLLGLELDKIGKILKCQLIVNKKTGTLTRATTVGSEIRSNYLVCGEAIEYLLSKLDVSKAIQSRLTKGDLEMPGPNGRVFKYSSEPDIVQLMDDLSKPFSRINLLLNMTTQSRKALTLRNIRVLPAGVRPVIDGRQDPTTELYRVVIDRNERLAHMSEQDTVNSYCQVAAALYKAVSDLYTKKKDEKASQGLREQLNHKEGLIRNAMLGKRVNYSGRSVIVVNPDLSVDEVALPYRVVKVIYSYHIDRAIRQDKNLSPRANISSFYNDDAYIRRLLETRILPTIPACMNRAPTMHTLGFLAYWVKIWDKMAIGLHPLACSGFNADFDGDTMAAHVPLSEDAILETSVLLLTTNNATVPANGKSTFVPAQEVVYGLHFLTKEEQGFEQEDFKGNLQALYHAVILQKVHAHARVSAEGITGTAGRLAVYYCLDQEQRRKYANGSLPTVTQSVLREIITTMYESGAQQFKAQVNLLIKLGFAAATIYAPTLDTLVETPEQLTSYLTDFQENMALLTQEHADGFVSDDEYATQYFNAFKKAQDRIGDEILDAIDMVSPNNGYCSLVRSGARGSPKSLAQLFVCKGRIQRSAGALNAVIGTPLKSQLTSLEHFVSAAGTRSSLMDKSNKPSETGDLWRRLNHSCAPSVITSPDCGTTKGLLVSRDELRRHIPDSAVASEFEKIIIGRWTADIKGRVLDEQLAREYYRNGYSPYIFFKGKEQFVNPATYETEDAFVDDVNYSREIGQTGEYITPERAKVIVYTEDRPFVVIRSPMTCEHHICSKCYGKNLAKRGQARVGMPAGFLAAQSIGEPGQQLAMRTFHHGGVAGGADIISAFDRFERFCELSELNPDNTPNYDPIAWATGPVRVKEVAGMKQVFIGDERNFTQVPVNAKLKPYAVCGEGLALQEGDHDIKELIERAGMDKAVTYLLFALHFAYYQQAEVNLKHFEILVSSMTRHVVISGDKDYSTGIRLCEAEMLNKPSHVKTIRKLYGLANAPKHGRSVLEHLCYQYLNDGLVAANVRTATDDVTMPYARMMMGLPPISGTSYPGYLQGEDRAARAQV